MILEENNNRHVTLKHKNGKKEWCNDLGEHVLIQNR